MGIEMQELPRNMSLTTLADHCLSEIQTYRRGEPCSDQHCLELFRRAILQKEHAAWALLVEYFQEFVLASFRRHPKRGAASLLDSPENYVAKAFERFWVAAAHNQKLEFVSLAAALVYLRSCLNGAILDALRADSRAKEVTLPEDYDFVDERTDAGNDSSRDLWDIIASILPAGREQRVAYLLFRCNLKPREIVQYCPQEFSNVHEIYRLRCNIIERLLRHSEHIRWRLNDEN